MDEFRKLEREARENGRGLWAEGGESEAKEIKYVASKKSGVFHRPSCKWAGMIDEKNRVEFSSRGEAVEEGYRPCQACRP